MPRSNVVDLQAKGYDLAAAARYNDTESHAKFLAMRRKMAGRKPYGGLFAVTLRRIMGVMIEHCDELLADAGVVQRMQDFQADMVLGDLFTNFCNAVLSDKLGGLPIVSLNSGAPFLPYLNSWWAGSGRRMWLPAPLAYVSQTGSGYISPMTFAQRLHNFYFYTANAAADYILLRPILLSARKRFGVDTRTPEATAREVLLLVCSDWAIEPPQPLPPNVKMVGAILTRPADPLPAELEARMRAAFT